MENNKEGVLVHPDTEKRLGKHTAASRAAFLATVPPGYYDGCTKLDTELEEMMSQPLEPGVKVLFDEADVAQPMNLSEEDRARLFAGAAIFSTEPAEKEEEECVLFLPGALPPGFKLTDQHGGCGVVCRIEPDDEIRQELVVSEKAEEALNNPDSIWARLGETGQRIAVQEKETLNHIEDMMQQNAFDRVKGIVQAAQAAPGASGVSAPKRVGKKPKRHKERQSLNEVTVRPAGLLKNLLGSIPTPKKEK